MSESVVEVSPYKNVAQTSDIDEIEKTLSRVNIVSPVKRGRSRKSTIPTTPKKSESIEQETSSPKRKTESPKWLASYVSPTKTRRIVSPAPENVSLTTKPSLDDSFRRTVLKINLTQCLDPEHQEKKANSRRTTRHYYYESCSDSDSNEQLIVTGKREVKPPVKYSDECTQPATPSSTRSTRRNTRNYYYEYLSESSDTENVIIDSKRVIKTPTKYLNSEVTKTPSRRGRKPLNKVETNITTPSKTTQQVDSYTSYNNFLEVKSTPSKRGRKPGKAAESTPVTPKKKHPDSDELSDVYTPRNRRLTNVQTPKSSIKGTPKNPAKLIRDGVITPSIHAREKSIVGDSTPLMKARSQLHVSHVPTALPCREKEYADINHFLEGKLLDGCGGCMYISGVPGTGKTATVTAVINSLLEKKKIPKFEYVSINGMRLTEPRQSYVEILKQLTGKTVPWEQAQSMLEEKFTKTKKKGLPVVMLIDELDILCTKRQDVVYNLLDWPTKAKNQLIVITIANTMDLPERLLMSRVTSRLGLTRLTFQAYTHKQLQEIVTRRLTGTNSFNPDAIQLVARKVASVSGDARRALDICRRAAEMAEMEDANGLVSMQHVNEALNAMITQPKVRAIRRCSRLEQLLLQAIVAEVERTGVEETIFADIYKMFSTVAALDDFKMVSCTNALAAISRLSASRLILTDTKCNDIYQRIILNVSVDDVYYALKRD